MRGGRSACERTWAWVTVGAEAFGTVWARCVEFLLRQPRLIRSARWLCLKKQVHDHWHGMCSCATFKGV